MLQSKEKEPSTDSYSFNRDLVIWLCRDLLPFSTVEGTGFKAFFGKNIPNMTIPDRSTMSKAALHDVYEALKSKVSEDLKSVESICIMFDGWTDKYQRRHFLGIRAKLIRPDWTAIVVTLSSEECIAQDDLNWHLIGLVKSILFMIITIFTSEY